MQIILALPTSLELPVVKFRETLALATEIWTNLLKGQKPIFHK
jgi:hypothetical protein